MKKRRTQVVLKSTKISRILVPIDFSDHSSNALRQAVFMAKTFMAKIDLIHVITPVYLSANHALMPIGDVFYGRLLKDAEKKMKEIAKDIKIKEGVEIIPSAVLGIVHDSILTHAKKINASLIIMGTHGTAGIKEFFAGSNAYKVVNNADCPVLTVQKRIVKKGFKTIVLPIRAELNSRQKVNLVATIAKMYMAKVLIIGYTDNNNKREKTKVKQYVSQVENFLKHEAIDCKPYFINNENFTKSIIDFASKQKADLIAIMTSHDFSLDQVLKGSYAQQFVNHSNIPVLSSPDTLKFEYSYSPSLSGMLPE